MKENIISIIKQKLENDYDVKYREINCKSGKITLVFIDNLCDSKFISEYIIAPIINSNIEDADDNTLKKDILQANIVDDVKSIDDAYIHILSGDVVIISDFFDKMLYCEAKGYVRRGVSIPITENVIKGPREGFTEAFVDNVSLIRRKIKNTDLKFETIYIGKKSNTTVVVSYIKNIAPEELVNQIKDKISGMDNSFILDISYVEEKLRDKKTVFDTVGYSEKPDIIASKLLEGRIAVIVDGSPHVLTVPYFFIENFQAGDDYYSNSFFSNFTRVLRYIAFLISLLLSGLYLAIITYHFSLLPSEFVLRIAISRAGVPFPTVVELLIMTFFFQALREAGIRLPQPVGQAMSIVGALILGDAAIGAGLASESTLIVVALSSICTFLIPKLYGALSISSLFIIVLSAVSGLPGFYIGLLIVIAHIAGLKTCGYPYLFPLGTSKKYKFKDIIFRGSLESISNGLFSEDDLN